MTMMKRTILLLSLLVATSSVLVGASITSSLRRQVVAEEDGTTTTTTTTTSSSTSSTSSTSSNNMKETGGFINEEAYVAKLAEKLRPYELETSIDKTGQITTVHLHQFLHLHHMKTGGTSMDGLLNCAMRRLQQKHRDRDDHAMKEDMSMTLAYMNIHECGLQRYRKCRDGEDSLCRDRINEAAILSYCAPLMDLEIFGWKRGGDDVDEHEHEHEHEESMMMEKEVSTAPTSLYKPHAVTVFRHPVNRVWSMFRFQTKHCYQCRNLTDVYAAIDAGDTKDMDESCIQQLLNHQTRNLISTPWRNSTEFNTVADPDILLEEAIDNMKNFFTLIGLTENMNDTAKMVGMVFPFMNETYHSTAGSGNDDDKCSMPHRNTSPQNNRCGKDGRSHWELPAHPDAATTQAILKHNQLDAILYEQAVQQFHYQKMALGLIDNGDGSKELDSEVPNQE